MAVVSRISRVTFDNGLGSNRVFLATAAVQDTVAGSSVVVTVTQTTAGIGPAVPDTMNLIFVNDAGGVIRTVSLTPGSGSQTVTFFFTSDGTSGGAARCGTVEMNLQVVKTTGGPTATYNAESDGTPATGPTGFTTTSDRGWIRGTTTVTLSTSNVAAGGAVPAVFAYPDVMHQRATLGAQTYVARTLTVAVGAVKSGATNSTTGPSFDRTHTGVVDTAFSAGSNNYPQTVTASNATLTGLPFTVFTSTTAPSVTVDPRLTRTPLFQLDDNTFGTPPLTKDRPDHRRLVSQQGFLGSRTTNARGEGVNGVTYNIALTPRKPGTAVTQTGLTTTTQGGQAGWNPTFTPWSSSLPGGIWDKTVTITSPTGYTGSFVVQNGSTEYSLIAKDPNVEVRVGANHVQGEGGRHFTAGMVIVANTYLVNTVTRMRVPFAQWTSASVVVVRGSNPLGTTDGTGTAYQYLDASGVWVDWADLTAAYAHPMTVSPADNEVAERRFVSDSTWGTRDIRFAVNIEYEGVNYTDSLTTINVGPYHLHDTVEAGGGVEPSDIAAIANAVWDEPTSESRVAGSFGAVVASRLDAAVSSRLATTDARLDRLDVAVSTRATPADVNGSTAALTASLTALAQQITDLAAAGVDDATAAQLVAARDAILAELNRTNVEVQ